jgi:hypothetical protein
MSGNNYEGNPMMNPFDLIALRAALASPAGEAAPRVPLTMSLLQHGLNEAGLLWSQPEASTIVTFWDGTALGPTPVMQVGDRPDRPHPIFWRCGRDTLVCRADEDFEMFVGISERGIQSLVNQWNEWEAWPCVALTSDETVHSTIRVPLFAGTTSTELSLLSVHMTRSIGEFYSFSG